MLAASVGAASATTKQGWLVISAGGCHTCGITTDGRLYCWGDNCDGELGVRDTASRSTPTLVSSHAWATVSAGAYHTCGLYTDGTRFCWGYNADGELGIGDTINRNAPR